MLDHEITLRIPGHPAPKGSLVCRRDPHHRLREDNPKTKPWRDKIADAVRRKWPTQQHAGPQQPLGVEVTFSVDRPAGHYGTGRNARTVKPSAPAFPSMLSRLACGCSGDTDKLLRLVLDAFQDTDVLPDDVQIVDVVGRKRYAVEGSIDPDVLPWPGAVIRLYPVEVALRHGGPA